MILINLMTRMTLSMISLLKRQKIRGRKKKKEIITYVDCLSLHLIHVNLRNLISNSLTTKKIS